MAPYIRHVPINSCECRYNEERLRWTALETWSFWKTFDIFASVLDGNCYIELVLTVDTVSTVLLNGAQVGQTANSHR